MSTKKDFEKNEIIDSLKLARKISPGKKNTLDALCERYSIDNSDRTLHGALLDAKLLAFVYLKMTIGQDDFNNLTSDESITKANSEIIPCFSSPSLKFKPRKSLLYFSVRTASIH